MSETIGALLGVVLGFLLPSVASLLRSYTTGRRFENAVRAELAEARELLGRKMRWILRDETGVTPDPRRDPSHVVNYCGRLLYLGEPEDFSVHLPFWEQNIKAVIEVTPAKAFATLFREVVLVNRFVSKFRDMKLAFTSGLGDPTWMAIACLGDLISIHDKLFPEQTLAETLTAPSAPSSSSVAAKHGSDT
ncbi:MAG: hypothetical protein H7062_10010 [Candidatus Saccharimonas sp.]|nr:hypothetical protein [Planctomycetaceae bacterium]